MFTPFLENLNLDNAFNFKYNKNVWNFFKFRYNLIVLKIKECLNFRYFYELIFRYEDEKKNN